MEGSGFPFKFIDKGYEWGDLRRVMRGGIRQTPDCPRWSLAPGWGRGGLPPNAGPTALVPSPLTQLQMGQTSGTALPPRTLAHRHTQLPQC